MLQRDRESLFEIIAICGSFLAVREDTTIFNQSAKLFLLRETKIGVLVLNTVQVSLPLSLSRIHVQDTLMRHLST